MGGVGWMPNRFHMMGNVFLLPGDQHRIQHGVHSQMWLTTDEPRRCVVRAAERGDREGTGMNAEFELLALAAFQDGKVQRHVVP